MILRPLSEQRADDDGFSLIELLMVMLIFTILGAILLSITTGMLRQQRRATAVGDNLFDARKILSRLDAQVRYANAVTSPGLGPDGNFYVEWRRNTGTQQTCTQWRRVTATNQIQYRSWQPLTGSPGTIRTGSQTNWVTIASTVRLTGTTPIFSITTNISPASIHEQLTVAFTSTTGSPPVSTTSQITITALNTAGTTAPPSSSNVCNEVTRS